MPTLYLSDGTAYNKIKKLYYSDGTANSKLKSLYESDGTAWHKVFSGYDCTASVSYYANNPSSLATEICYLNEDSSGYIRFETVSSSTRSGVNITFTFQFNSVINYYADSTVLCAFNNRDKYTNGRITEEYVKIYDSSGHLIYSNDDLAFPLSPDGNADNLVAYADTDGSTDTIVVKSHFFVSGDEGAGRYQIEWDSLTVLDQDLSNIEIV